jgi:hypothetical protein
VTAAARGGDRPCVALAPGHRLNAISVLAATLNSAAGLSIAAASSGAHYRAKPDGFGGNLVDGPARRLRRFGFLGHAASIGRELCTFDPAETEPPREPRPPKTAPRLCDGSLMLLAPALIVFRACIAACLEIRSPTE